MVMINLLPWREYADAHEKRALRRIFASGILLPILVLIAGHQIATLKTTQLEDSIRILQNKINHHLVPIKHPLDTPDIQVIAHPDTVTQRLFAALESGEIGDVCYTDIIRNHEGIIFKGRARSSADLTGYLKNWPAATLFSEINIHQVEQRPAAYVEFQFLGIQNE